MADTVPLATKLAPQSLQEYIGQEHLVGESGPIKKMLEQDTLTSMIFWGPPGSGKTSLAQIISKSIDADFQTLSAVSDGKARLKQIISIARDNQKMGKATILFIDEIHRWNKAQQDALLPHVEAGTTTLIGATTENPSFTVIAPLLSRARVFIFKQHDKKNLKIALAKGLKHLDRGMSEDAQSALINYANHDLRYLLNSLELATQLTIEKTIQLADIEQVAQRPLRYDRAGEEHYNLISATHKSLRSSNSTAAVYWIMRMLNAGEDPLYIARRLLRFASEDIGNANPNALLLANQVYETCQKLGMPECDTALVQLAQYLANSAKDNSAYAAIHAAKQDIKKHGNLPVPLHLRNAPTKFMKNIGYGKGYEYDHNLKGKKSGQKCMPKGLEDQDYFK